MCVCEWGHCQRSNARETHATYTCTHGFRYVFSRVAQTDTSETGSYRPSQGNQGHHAGCSTGQDDVC